MIDPTHTFVTYEIGHFGTSTNRGRFDKKEGTVQFDRAAKTGKVEVVFDLKSVSTGVAPLDKHLQSADFFDTAKFPSAKFVGDKFVFNGDKVAQVSGHADAARQGGAGDAEGQQLQLLHQPDAQARGLRRRFRDHHQAQPVGHELRAARWASPTTCAC